MVPPDQATIYRLAPGLDYDHYLGMNPVMRREYMRVCTECYLQIERVAGRPSILERISGSSPFVGDFLVHAEVIVCRRTVAEEIVERFPYLKLEGVACVGGRGLESTYEEVTAPDDIAEITGFPVVEFDTGRSSVKNVRRCSCGQFRHSFIEDASGVKVRHYRISGCDLAQTPMVRISGSRHFFCSKEAGDWLGRRGYSNLHLEEAGHVGEGDPP
jgi:hypothetical protein